MGEKAEVARSLRVVLDTNVLVSALRSNRGASYQILRRVGPDAAFRSIVSVPLVLEYEMALKRGTSFAEDDVEKVLDYLCQVSDRRRIHFLWRPFLRDPRDEMVLEVAVEGRADAIVTHNVREFRRVAGLRVENWMSPGSRSA